ncbi:methylthioribose-1-phosphate isomerase [Hydrogenivirga caldilitoris]|uniref:Methylthioribose-1-phosphate isomerase n=1 Tax=Hydrogenivirga caldilitoris TaxID=246264 RepID=A0A497XRM0_9AQUI|nr:S-methyl-5-thioribose-1-phosphate isomerase [Hydrogenivirga caldilitoris]RLJ70924.1 methylthioribose-1-phosphate isomerase [Hydrogenivirga caldilitoris]
MEVKAFYWKGDYLLLLDQRKLPQEEVWLELRDHIQVAQAIINMSVRGAPAIGCVAAYGFVLGVKRGVDPREVYEVLKSTRPTAYNLFWALDRMLSALSSGKDIEQEAQLIEREDYEANKRIGELGNELIPEGARLLTHCNTGALATAGWGTALGVIRTAHYSGKGISVWVDETRPYLQGARLTAWELLKEGVPHKLITDSTAGFLMKKGLVDLVIVGADRITAVGDVANKIGTYSLSVLAKEHGVPFYVAAPSSTFDLSTRSGEDIPIEERGEEEVKNCFGAAIAPGDTPALHLAFDVTPAENITAIITERGIIKPVNEESIQRCLS